MSNQNDKPSIGISCGDIGAAWNSNGAGAPERYAGSFLRTSSQTYEICRGVNSPSCKILYDIYHMQKNEGNLIKHIELAWNEIAYFQIGDNPGRNEPTTGEINYKNIFKYIHSRGYKGVMGMEHGNSKPGKDGEMAVIKAYRESDSFL